MSHIFTDDGKQWKLIPVMPVKPDGKNCPSIPHGFKLIEYNKQIEVAKANALPIVNPETIFTVMFVDRRKSWPINGHLYEWPGTWETVVTGWNEKNQAITAAKLIAPQQNSAHGYTEGADVPQQPQAEKTDNELIAEFMGLKSFNDSRYGILWPDPLGSTESQFGLKYSKSWDWLMPVVEKIHNDTPRAFKVDLFSGPISPLAKLNIYSPIAEVYKEVVEFIKWYNTQPKQP